MDEHDSTEIGGCGKAGYVADNTAANGDYKRPPIGSGSTQRASDMLHALKVFCRFCVVEKMNCAAIRNSQAAL
jgi:hypothetical protein